jgi:hypothetical protein
VYGDKTDGEEEEEWIDVMHLRRQAHRIPPQRLSHQIMHTRRKKGRKRKGKEYAKSFTMVTINLSKQAPE